MGDIGEKEGKEGRKESWERKKAGKVMDAIVVWWVDGGHTGMNRDERER